MLFKIASACVLPRQIGTCRASFTRWSYDVENSTCEKFNFGGCEGNDNNFETYEECTKTCGSKNTFILNLIFINFFIVFSRSR